MPPDLQMYLLIPRIIETLLFALIISNVNRPFRNIRFNQRPLLHRLFLAGLSGWFVYIFLDIFIYSLADLSFDPNIPIKVMGYQWAYPSLFFANIARDIAYAGVMVECWAYFFVPIAISRGEAYTQKFLKHKPIMGIILLISGLLMLNENLIVWVFEDKIIITENYDGIGALSLLLVSILYLISGLYMFRVLRQTVQEDKRLEYAKKVRYFSWGILHMGLGYVWAIFWNVMGLFFIILTEPPYYLSISFMIHALWGASGILIYKGLNIKLPAVQGTPYSL